MLRWLKIFAVSLPLIAVLAACSQFTNNTCGADVSFPLGGYPYPKNINPSDTEFFSIQIKDSLDRRDSFHHAIHGWRILKSWNEPNLSLAPSGDVIFRLFYEGPLSTPFVMTIFCDRIVLKIADSGYAYPLEDVSRLSEIEKIHYQILKRRFPIDLNSITVDWRRRYLDSMITLYPELQSPAYYKSILEKSFNYDSLPFKYSTYTLNITSEKYSHHIKKINKSGFWVMPILVEEGFAPTDGDGYIIEAHLPERYKVVQVVNSAQSAAKLAEGVREIIDIVKPKNRKLDFH